MPFKTLLRAVFGKRGAALVNHDLVNYIERHLEKGFHSRKVKHALKEAGHPVEAVEDAFEFVFQKKPHLRKKPKTGMIIYGFLIIIIITALIYFGSIKYSQYQDYQLVLQDYDRNQSYIANSDLDLIKMAAAGDMYSCNFITDPHINYACFVKQWETDDCAYLKLIGKDTDKCYSDRALSRKDLNTCFEVSEPENCLFSLAKAEDDISFCSSYMSCIISFAKSKKSASFCNELSATTNQICMDTLAKEFKDSSLCNSTECRLSFLTKAEKKKYIMGLVSPEDVVDYIFDSEDPELCDTLTGTHNGTSVKQYCLDQTKKR